MAQETGPPNAAEIILLLAASPGHELWGLLEQSSGCINHGGLWGSSRPGCLLPQADTSCEGCAWVGDVYGGSLQPCQIVPHRGELGLENSLE